MFVHANGKPLTSAELTTAMRSLLRRGGVPGVEGFSARSLRKGGSQTLLDAGLSVADIKVAGTVDVIEFWPLCQLVSWGEEGSILNIRCMLCMMLTHTTPARI